MKKIITLLCFWMLIFSMIVCFAESDDNCKKISISVSKETEKFLDDYRQSHSSILDEAGWKSIILKQITQRETGNLELPLTEQTSGQTVNLKNRLTEKIYGQTHVYTLNPPVETEKVILYVHGGSYIFNINSKHINYCDTLCSELNAKVCMPLYNLAPQGNYREAYRLLHNVYNELLTENKPICVMGDSSGGGLALGFVMDLKEKSKKLPDKLILLSPWLDVTMSNPENNAYTAKDYVLSAYGLVESGKLWADGDDVNAYRLSPLNGDISGLPSTLITVGTAEMFYPDNKLLFQKYQEKNLPCIFIEGEKMPHVFPLQPFPEAEKARCLILNFLRKR